MPSNSQCRQKKNRFLSKTENVKKKKKKTKPNAFAFAIGWNSDALRLRYELDFQLFLSHSFLVQCEISDNNKKKTVTRCRTNIFIKAIMMWYVQTSNLFVALRWEMNNKFSRSIATTDYFAQRIISFGESVNRCLSWWVIRESTEKKNYNGIDEREYDERLEFVCKKKLVFDNFADFN